MPGLSAPFATSTVAAFVVVFIVLRPRGLSGGLVFSKVLRPPPRQDIVDHALAAAPEAATAFALALSSSSTT